MNVGVWDVVKSVFLFLGVFLVVGVVMCYIVFFVVGKVWFEKWVVFVISLLVFIGLLFIIFVMFVS